MPGWVRLVRSGSRFEAFRSSDGITWISMGTDVVPMTDGVYVGIATTSHNINATTRADLDVFRLVPMSARSPAPTTAPPTSIVFQASVDHPRVTSYRLDIFASGATPSTATPVATSDLGKPAPDAAGDITVNRATFFSALAPGSYQATVSSVRPPRSP